MSQSYLLNQKHTDPRRLRKERDLGRSLKMSAWWKAKLQEGRCHHCQGSFAASDLTMDHVLPLSRGGKSTKDNVVPACLPCNQKKGLKTDQDSRLEDLFAQLAEERHNLS